MKIICNNYIRTVLILNLVFFSGMILILITLSITPIKDTEVLGIRRTA